MRFVNVQGCILDRQTGFTIVWEVDNDAVDEALSGFKLTLPSTKDGSHSADQGRGCRQDACYGNQIVGSFYESSMLEVKVWSRGYKTSEVHEDLLSFTPFWLARGWEITRDGAVWLNVLKMQGSLLPLWKRLAWLLSLRRGTKVTFMLDPTIFSTTDFKFTTTIAERKNQPSAQG